VAGAANPTAIVVTGPGLIEVPTLSPFGLLLLMVVLADSASQYCGAGREP